MNSDEEFFAKQRGLMMIGTILHAYAGSSLQAPSSPKVGTGDSGIQTNKQLCSLCGSCMEMFLFAVCTVGESKGIV